MTFDCSWPVTVDCNPSEAEISANTITRACVWSAPVAAKSCGRTCPDRQYTTHLISDYGDVEAAVSGVRGGHESDEDDHGPPDGADDDGEHVADGRELSCAGEWRLRTIAEGTNLQKGEKWATG